MTYNSNTNKSIIRENQSAPSLSSSYAIQQGARESGLFAPEQQSFLGASITNFSVQNGDGSSPSSLSVELVEDPDFNNYVNEISGVGGFEYDRLRNGYLSHRCIVVGHGSVAAASGFVRFVESLPLARPLGSLFCLDAFEVGFVVGVGHVIAIPFA